MWQSNVPFPMPCKGLSIRSLIFATTGGPKVMFGTKWPSMMSTCSQSAPCFIVLVHSSANTPKSADRMEGAIIASGAVMLASCAVGSGEAGRGLFNLVCCSSIETFACCFEELQSTAGIFEPAWLELLTSSSLGKTSAELGARISTGFKFPLRPRAHGMFATDFKKHKYHERIAGTNQAVTIMESRSAHFHQSLRGDGCTRRAWNTHKRVACNTMFH